MKYGTFSNTASAAWLFGELNRKENIGEEDRQSDNLKFAEKSRAQY